MVGIVALAAWLRLRNLGLAEFKSDEALAVRIGRDIIHGEVRTVGLTSSAGASNPPLFVYLTALPLAVWNNPLFATAFVGVLMVIAVALTYFLLRNRFGCLVALVAAGLLATAPWAVLYGRHLWQPDVLPIVTASLLWTLFATIERERSRAVLLVPVFLCLALQLNFSALALVVPILVVVAYRARHLNWAAFAAGICISLVLLGPWLAHNAKHRFRDFIALAKEGRGHGGTPGAGAVEAVRQTVHLLGVGGWKFVTGSNQTVFAHEAGWAWTLGRTTGAAAVVLFAFGLVTCLISVLRNTHRRHGWPLIELTPDAARRALFLTWLVGVWLSYALSSTEKVAPHYLILTYPVTFIVIAIGLSDTVSFTRDRYRRRATLASVAAAAVIMVGFVAFTLSFQRFVARHGGTAGDYGVIYRDKTELAAAARTRHLDVDDPVLEYLATGSFTPQPGTTRFVTTRDRLVDAKPLACTGKRRTFGPLEACLPSPSR